MSRKFGIMYIFIIKKGQIFLSALKLFALKSLFIMSLITHSASLGEQKKEIGINES